MKAKKSVLAIKSLKISITIIIVSTFLFTAFGTITAVIPNNFFSRMTPTGILDYGFLVLTSALLGTYIVLHFFYRKKHSISQRNRYTAFIGAVPSIFSFSCPVCNILLVYLFGVTGVLLYFEPLRPLFGFLGIGILTLTLCFKIQDIRGCSACSKLQIDKKTVL